MLQRVQHRRPAILIDEGVILTIQRSLVMINLLSLKGPNE